jgi:uncharacterized protein YjbI with pentapeptide repeats
MRELLAAVPIWAWLVLVGVILVAGYTIFKGITGFGIHDVKTITTFEYEGDDAIKGAPDPTKEGLPQKRSIAKEERARLTIWDWMSVLTISAAIAGVTVYFTWSQGEQQQNIQEQEAMEASLQAYLDQMTQMILDDKNALLNSESDSVVRVIARVRTVTALKRLDGKRNKVVLSFLKESGLLGFGVPGEPNEGVVELDDADLSDVDLADTSLSGLNLRFANLRRADLQNANLGITNLTFAELAHANLEGADLRDADLLFADLDDANLKEANFNGATLSYADLSGANLKSAKNLSQEQIDEAAGGDSATQLPDHLDAPSWWSKRNSTVRDPLSRLGASLAPLKSAKAGFGDEIGIPQDVGTSKQWGGTYGTLVSDVQPGSLAHNIGFRPGDIILYVGKSDSQVRSPVQGLEDMKADLDQLDQHQPGSQVQFSIKRWYFHKGWRKGALEGKIDN